MWRAKQKAPCVASGEVPTQFHLSREDKGKMPIQFGTIANISLKAKSVALTSPDLEVLAPGANLTPVSKGVDGFRALVPKGTNKILNHEAGTEALCSAKCLRSKAKSKAPQRATTKASITSHEAADGVANTRPVPFGTNPALSHRARTEALFSASYLRRKVQNKAPQRAKREVAVTSPPKSSEAKLTPHRGATHLTSPSEVNIADYKVIFKSRKARSFKARGLQSEPSRPVSCKIM